MTYAWTPPSNTYRHDGCSGSLTALLHREQRLAALCLGMTQRGLRVDRGLTRELDEDYALSLSSLREFIRNRGVENPDSAAQLATAFDAAGVRYLRTAKGNPNLDDQALQAIDHPLAGLVREYRKIAKDRSNYTQSFLKFSQYDGRVHPSINQAEASTWRMSITKPALQTIPKYGSPLRSCFVADSGSVFISGDLNSVELVIAAALSGDEALTAKLLSGESVWDEVRERVFPGAPKESKQHTWTKNIGYGTMYGGGVNKLSGYAHGDKQLTASVRNTFWRTYPQLHALFRHLIELGSREGGALIQNPYGRPIHIPPQAPYKGLNFLIQSTGRDILVDSMFALDDVGFGNHIWLPVHDELVLQVPEQYTELAMNVLGRVMTTKLGDLPITCSVDKPTTVWGKG